MTRKSGTTSSNRQIFWQKHIDKWSTSGLSQAQYCRNHSLNAWTFCTWKNKLQARESPPAEFVAVKLPSSDKSVNVSDRCELCLKLSNGMSIEVSNDFSQKTLERLLKIVTPLT